MMQDFRDSQQYQIFTACRTKRDKYHAAIDTFDQTASKDMSAAKRAAIEAMAYNESCLLSAKKIDLSQSDASLKEVGVQALLAYRDRANAENTVMASIITNQLATAGEKALQTYTVIAVEKSRFARLDSYPKPGDVSATPLWIYVAALVVVVLAIRSYLKNSASETEPDSKKKESGVIRQTFHFTKGFAQGLYGEFKTIRNGMKEEKKKDGEDV